MADQEECGAEFQPVVKLEEVEVFSGEEGEDMWLDYKCKLYRLDGQEWKERGLGQIRLLQSKEDQRVRLLMRQEKTLKIRANHYLLPGIELQSHSGNDKAWVWRAVDYADGDEKIETFCVRFASAERAQDFQAQFEKGQQENEKQGMGKPAISDEQKEAAEKDADELATKIEATTVDDDKKE